MLYNQSQDVLCASAAAVLSRVLLFSSSGVRTVNTIAYGNNSLDATTQQAYKQQLHHGSFMGGWGNLYHNRQHARLAHPTTDGESCEPHHVYACIKSADGFNLRLQRLQGHPDLLAVSPAAGTSNMTAMPSGCGSKREFLHAQPLSKVLRLLEPSLDCSPSSPQAASDHCCSAKGLLRSTS